MTKINNPSVIIVTGKVNITKIGLMSIFAKPITAAATNAMTKLDT